MQVLRDKIEGLQGRHKISSKSFEIFYFLENTFMLKVLFRITVKMNLLVSR